MGLNKSKGQMFPWVDYTWNPIKGCEHECVYCYLRSMRNFSMKPRLSEKELTTNLGDGRTIFVGSASDMWGSWVPAEWITKVISWCSLFDNTYLFQTKNPQRFLGIRMPHKVIYGVTIETDGGIWYDRYSQAPPPIERVYWMKQLVGRKMLSLEPIMDFEHRILVRWISSIRPEFVSIGGDSKGHRLIEPSSGKIIKLIEALKPMTKVILKSNLKRLIGEIGYEYVRDVGST